ncbi:MAG: NHL repeat-containing protein, partial [Tepidiformaceae bacterium]
PETWRVIGSGVFGGGWLDTWFHYWRDHDPDALSGKMGERACNSCGSVDAYAFFPANFDPARGTITLKPIEPPKPRADSAGRPTFGGAGTQPGQFFSPVDIEADSAGNLYVIDYGTRRLQKFDPAGNFLASTDVRGEQGGVRQASEPWGLAVAPDGTVAVADTFGHRIRLFDGNLQPLLAFGQAADLSRPVGPLDFFGPRDAAFDPQGNLWVTDTGNHRLLVFNRQGESLRVIGKNGAGEGEFREPVGVAIGPGGAVYVADMYNARVVVLDGEGRFRSSFKVDGWGGQDVQDKPYLEVLPNGNIAVGLPGQNQVRVYTPSGALSATIAPEDEPLSRPYGILATVDGKLWVVEGGSKRVRLFPIP